MNFEIDYFLVSDYATQSIDGKLILGGVYPSEIGFLERPAAWSSFFVTVCLRSLQPEYDFTVELQSPDGTKLFSLQGEHRAEIVSESSRVVLQTAIPVQPFTGPGNYKIVAYDPKGATWSEKILVVRIGAATAPPPAVTAQMTAGPIPTERPVGNEKRKSGRAK